MSEINEMLLNDHVVGHDKKVRTKIMAGYDLYKDQYGISQLGEQVIEPQENKVVLAGILHILKSIFKADIENDITVKSLNELMNIGTQGIKNSGANPVAFGFNVGLGGCGASYADEKEVLDQQNIVPDIIPIRVVDSVDELGELADKYWFKRTLDNGKIAFYIKEFQSKPKIYVLWKDNVNDDEDGNPVVGDPSESSRTEGIESFVELILNISAQDLREYFELYDPTGSKYARFNSIGLCIGTPGVLTEEEREGENEYLDVTQFSVLNFSNEMLHFDKDLSIIYRVYIS